MLHFDSKSILCNSGSNIFSRSMSYTNIEHVNKYNLNKTQLRKNSRTISILHEAAKQAKYSFKMVPITHILPMYFNSFRFTIAT